MIGADGKNSVARRVLLAEQDEAEEADSTTTGSEKSALSPIKAIVGCGFSHLENYCLSHEMPVY